MYSVGVRGQWWGAWGSMFGSLDVFRMDPGNRPMWVGSVNDMKAAREMIRQRTGEHRARFPIRARETASTSIHEATKDEVVLASENVGALAR
jgi:hypothetical protein